MNISKATLQDIPQLVTLINSAYRGEHSKKGWTTEADLLGGLRTDPDSLEKMMNKQDAVILKFCNEDNVLQGCVYLEKKGTKCIWECLQFHRWNRQKALAKNFYLRLKNMQVIKNVLQLK